MVVTGDLTQIDLPPGVRSGLTDALDTLEGVPRHRRRAGSTSATWCAIRWWRRIVDAYDQRDAARQDARRSRAAAEGPGRLGDGPIR